jgi:hypothetical protein
VGGFFETYSLLVPLEGAPFDASLTPGVCGAAEQEGDQELVEFFEAVLEHYLTAAQRAKEMLVPRLQGEQE